MTILRAIQKKDVPTLAQMMASTALWQRYNVTEDSAARRLQSGLDQGATILVAEIDQTAVGFVWYVMNGAFNRSGYIMLIGVEQSARGAGLGRALMREAETIMFEKVNDVFLLVSDFNSDAQKFYQRLGYEQVGTIQDYVINGVDELIFRQKK
ncbi:MAG: GNAT family N-acetyltransferase [Chloroflexi bacterium]|nr:GNAT family N-acetyltransferase [Chloroflexota bacterium]